MATKKAYVKYKKKSVKKNQKKLEILFKIIHKRLDSRHAGSNEKISLGWIRGGNLSFKKIIIATNEINLMTRGVA